MYMKWNRRFNSACVKSGNSLGRVMMGAPEVGSEGEFQAALAGRWGSKRALKKLEWRISIDLWRGNVWPEESRTMTSGGTSLRWN